MPNQPNTQGVLMPLDKVASDLKMPIADAAKLTRIYNGMKPVGENKVRLQTIRNEQFITNGEAERVKTFFENKLVDINGLERATGVPYHHIKAMCDKCSDDRISALLPDAAKVRPIVLNGTYYFDKKYIDKFQDRISQFNDIIDIVTEKADALDKEVEEELELAEMMQKRNQEPEEEETASQENEDDIDEEEFDDFDDDAEEIAKEREEKKKELQKKRRAEFKKEIERGSEEYKKLQENKRIENEKRAEAAQELLKKQAESTAEMLKRQEENARLYREHTEKVQSVIGDKYSSSDENMLAQMRENQEKYREEQDRQIRLADEAKRAAEESARAREASEKAREESKRLADEAKRMDDARKAAENARTEADRQRLSEEARRAEDEARRANENARRAEEEYRRANEEAARLRAQSENQQQSSGNQSLAEQERNRKMQEELARAENEAKAREENNRKAQEESARRAEEARQADANRRAAEAYRTEEGRKQFEEQTRKTQEDARRAENERVRKENESKATAEQARRAESEYKSYNPTTESPSSYRENILSQATEEAKRIAEDYKKAQEDYQRANKQVEEYAKRSAELTAEIERARRNNESAKVYALTEEAKKTSENFAKAASESAVYAVTASALETSKNAAEATLKAAEEARAHNARAEQLEAESRRNAERMEALRREMNNYSPPPSSPAPQPTTQSQPTPEYRREASGDNNYSQTQDKGYTPATEYKPSMPSSTTIPEPPKDAPKEYREAYKEYKQLETKQAEIHQKVEETYKASETAVSKTTEYSGKLKETHQAVSTYIHTQQVDAVEGVNKRMGELNEQRTTLYGDKGYTRIEVPTQQMYIGTTQNYTTPSTPKYEAPKAPKMDPVVIKDGNGSAAVVATGKDYKPTQNQSPTITSGSTSQSNKDMVSAMNSAALAASVIKDTSASPIRGMEKSTIDFGAYQITYTYDKANSADFQKFAESVATKKMEALNNGTKTPTSANFAQSLDPRFKATDMVYKNGETKQISKEAVKEDKHKARGGTRATATGQTDTDAPNVKGTKMTNIAYMKINAGAVVHNATDNVMGRVGGYLARTETFEGIAKTYRTTKCIGETISFFLPPSSATQYGVKNIANFVKSDGKKGAFKIAAMGQQKRLQATGFSEMNEILKKHNAEGGKYALLDDSFGLAVKQKPLSQGSKGLQELFQKNNLTATQLSKMSAADIDKLIKDNPKLKAELLGHKKLNALLGEKGGLANMTQTEKAKLFEKLKDKNMKKAFAMRDEVRGFGKDFNPAFKQGPRRMWMRNATRANEQTLMQFIANNSKNIRMEDLKKMSSDQLKMLLKGGKGLSEDAKKALGLLIQHRELAERFSAAFKKGLRSAAQSIRRVSQSNESMAGFYEISDALKSAKGIGVGTYKVGRTIFRGLRLNKTRWAQGIYKSSEAVKQFLKNKTKDLKELMKKGGKKVTELGAKGVKAGAKKVLGEKRVSALKAGRAKAKGRLSAARNKAKDILGKVKGRLGKIFSPLAKPFSIAGGALKNAAALLKALMSAIRAIIDALKAVLHYIIIGIAIVIGVILLTNLLMYVSGTVGGMITSFFENLFTNDIMESTAGSTLIDLMEYDRMFYEELDAIAKKAEDVETTYTIKGSDGKDYSGASFLASVGCPETYGFINPNATSKDGNNIPYNKVSGFLWFGARDEYRYRIHNPGDPYGSNGYEQHYYNQGMNNIARYSNAKDILSIAYAGYDGKVNIIEEVLDDSKLMQMLSDDLYGSYCRNMWNETHLCVQSGCSKDISAQLEWTWEKWPKSAPDWFCLYIPKVQIKDKVGVHCHTTNVYVCASGKCDGDSKTYFYYCNYAATGNQINDTQKLTHWVYNVKIYNNKDLSPTGYKLDSAYLCVLNGDTAKSGYSKKLFDGNHSGLGCKKVMCVNGAGSFTKNKDPKTGATTYVYNGTTYDLGYNKPQGTKTGTTDKVDCDSYTINYCNPGCKTSYHTVKQASNGTCQCSKVKNHGDIMYSTGYWNYGENVYYNASLSKNSNCNQKLIKDAIYLDCGAEYEDTKVRLKGTWFDENGTDRGEYDLGSSGYVGVYSQNCKHKVEVGTTEAIIGLVYRDSNGNETYAGYLSIPVTEYACGGKKTNIYVCQGECNGYSVCGGHAYCNGHYVCESGHTMTYCLGHVKAYSKIKILGVYDQHMFSVARGNAVSAVGNDSFSVRSDVKSRLANTETQDFAVEIYEGDWQDLYNISFQKSDTVAIPLSQAEQALLLAQSMGKGKADIVNTALACVGRLGYNNEWYLSTPINSEAYKLKDTKDKSVQDIIKEKFNVITSEPDIRGRMLGGLTESTFIQHMYYSTGYVSSYNKNDFSSFLSNFKTIEQKDLQPGDIIVMPYTKNGTTQYIATIYIRTITSGKVSKFLVVRCSNENSCVIYDCLVSNNAYTYYTFNN